MGAGRPAASGLRPLPRHATRGVEGSGSSRPAVPRMSRSTPMKIPFRRARETLLTRLGRHELPMLVLPGPAAPAVWSFIALAAEVTEGETPEIDRRLPLALRRPTDHTDPL